MMSFPLIIKPEAELDIKQAFEWYESKQAGLGRGFVTHLDQTFLSVSQSPESRAVVEQEARLALVRHFPFVVCYTFDGSTVFVHCVFHGHRDPTSWQSRLD
jgi:plasmid stabilization system protein ParE